jgi:SAM-dependent methyltransferase
VIRSDLPFSAAAERNKDPILSVLETVLPAEGRVLEIASGTGQHVCFFAEALPRIQWQPSEPDAEGREAITLRAQAARLGNIAAPLALDVLESRWPVETGFDAILCINMVHISPWAATLALMRGAVRYLAPEGKLLLYGPYLENGTATASNLEFDASLKRRNPEWGLRELEEVTRVAASLGLHRQPVVRMPANNLTLIFTRAF